MSSWTGGYVAELDYTHGFYRELAPSHLRYVLLCKGMDAPLIDRPFTYCELGCGQGYTSNLLAAANPNGEFYATDFNPVHAANARAIAREAGTPNVHFFDNSFREFCDRPDLPDFDFIVLHGIFSWIAPQYRQDIIEFIGKKLKVGGLVYLSYNALPGWSAFLGLRELMSAHIQASAGPLVGRIDTALSFSQQVTEQDSQYFASQPAAIERLKQISGMSRNYLAHEYFNQYWQPFFHREIAELLEAVKVNFVVSANLAEQMDNFCLRPAQLQTIQGITDSKLRETLRDVYLNQTFRRDIFARGALQLTSLQQSDRLSDQPFALAVGPKQVPTEHRLPLATVQLGTEPFTKLVPLLAERPRSLGELVKEFPQVALSDLHLALAIIVDGGWGMPVSPQAEAARAPSHGFNRALTRRATTEAKLNILASPLTGSGIGLDHTVLLFLESIWSDRPGPDLAFETYKRMGIRVQQDGQPLESDEANFAALKAAWENFEQIGVPWLKTLQIL